MILSFQKQLLATLTIKITKIIILLQMNSIIYLNKKYSKLGYLRISNRQIFKIK